MKAENETAMTNSNTTNVKVKYTILSRNGRHDFYSNTTNVKVKSEQDGRAALAKAFKYNQC